MATSLSGLQAQSKKINSSSHTWLAYNNQTRLGNKWGFWLDAHLYSLDRMVSWSSQLELRPGLTYYVNDDTRLTAGYAFINNYPVAGGNRIAQPEHRGWQQVQWFTRTRRLRAMQWLRLEERFVRKVATPDSLSEDYNYTWRGRYHAQLSFPLSLRPGLLSRLSLVVSDELLINFGKNVSYNYFDQNRFFVGGSFQINKQNSIQAGYMNLFQQLAAGNTYRRMDVLRVFYFQNLDFR
jgi:hypothetical protein